MGSIQSAALMDDRTDVMRLLEEVNVYPLGSLDGETCFDIAMNKGYLEYVELLQVSKV